MVETESGLDLVFHAIAGAFDDDRLGMMEEPIQHGGGQRGVVVEDAGPLFERFVSGQHDGTALVALADNLEEQVGAMLVDGQVADLIQNQQPGTEVFAEFTFEAAAFLGGAQLVDGVASARVRDGKADAG